MRYSLSCVFTALLLTTNTCLAAQSGAAAVPTETARKVRAFLDWFVDPHKTPPEQAALFTDSADYYDRGAIGKAAMLFDIERYQRHWPYRSYRVVGIDYLSADPGTDRVFVAYSVAFTVANRSHRRSGTARYGAVIGNVHGAPKVEAIEEKIDKRK